MLDNVPPSPSRSRLHVPFLKGSTHQNLITCLYETKLAGLCRHVTITWLRNANEHGLNVTVDDPSCQYTCKVKMSPWSFWKKQGVKGFELCGSKVEVFWDLTSAKYSYGPEPQHGFYVAVVCNREVVLLLGDRSNEAYRRTKARPCIIEATLLSRKEHIFGKKLFKTRAAIDETGKAHDITIECDMSPPKEPHLIIKVDKQIVVQVKNLEWKFRGNQLAILDGVPVQVFWDVHHWLFNSGVSNAVFIFKGCGTLHQKSFDSKIDAVPAAMKWSGDLNGSVSVMKLAGTRSLRSSNDLVQGMTGSSLLLNAWKFE